MHPLPRYRRKTAGESLPRFQRVSVFSAPRAYRAISYGNSPAIGREWARETLLRLFHHNMASFLIIMAVESEKHPGCTSCGSPSPPLQPQIDSLPGYAPKMDSLPGYGRKRPQAWCLTARNDVGALPGYAGKICHNMREVTAATIDEVIRTLNLKIIGWSNYFKTQVSKKAFQRLDDQLWHKMYRWAKRKHNTKNAKWTLEKYFKPDGKRKHHKIMGKTHTLRWHDETMIERHIPLRGDASPYDGNWSYWGTRKGKYIGLDTTRGKLLKHQGGRCTYCRLFFTMDDYTEIHHEDGNHKNNTYGSPIFKAVPKKQCKALYRALTKSLKSPESAVGEGSGRSNVEGSVAVPQ